MAMLMDVAKVHISEEESHNALFHSYQTQSRSSIIGVIKFHPKILEIVSQDQLLDVALLSNIRPWIHDFYRCWFPLDHGLPITTEGT